MTVPGVLLTLLLLQGAAGDSVTLKEGENLNLHCSFSTLSSTSSTLQWLNPDGFTIFLNAQQALRDQRYKLLHYSKDELSIQLCNVTVQDEGIYSCFSYSSHFQSRRHNVQVLAAPSHPVLEVSQDEGRGIKLSCYTQGSKPQPQISWLLDNGIELTGDTKHQLGADGKKWSTSSTLRILSYSPQGTASCILQHPALGGERLMASLPFQDLPSAGCKQPTRLSEGAEGPSTSENPAVPSSPENPADAEVPSPSSSPVDAEVSSPSASPKYPGVSSPSASPNDPGVSSSSTSPKYPEDSSPSSSPKDPEVSSPSSSPKDPEDSSPSSFPEDAEVPSPSSSPKDPEISSSPKDAAPTPTQPNLTDVTSNGPEETTTAEELGGSSSSGGSNGTETTPSGNVTEEEPPRTEVPPPHENTTGIPTPTLERDPEFKGIIKKEKNLLLPILVAALIFVLLIIVLLFMVKLKKAHGVWKRENDVSEQTLESYKSRSNEDSPGHERNGQAVNPKSNMQYITEGHVETPEKNPETPEKNPGDKTMAISEKMFQCGRETDV
ncbi:cytotoxic and regulatory T-cell molecule isoform X2 [Oenanthe melanoleuca]|uniref:cytotoxic and regulatory T-cell molecule isoform X2 n=1 Tax=Oenanthe melanoleuca TaxID=2939378 RepID=UPI0024C19475|nr:cytotoxic and regulatory T-cell molecule isoform X2 [Oenanthe melanoleuca]